MSYIGVRFGSFGLPKKKKKEEDLGVLRKRNDEDLNGEEGREIGFLFTCLNVHKIIIIIIIIRKLC
jgi:hypothetical protein